MTLQQLPNTNIYSNKEFILRTKNSSFPFKRYIKKCGFDSPFYETLSLDARVSDLFKLLGFSRSAFNSKLKEGAIKERDYRRREKNLSEDKLLEQGILQFRIKRWIIDVWFLKTYKITFIDSILYFLEPIFVYPINRMTRKVFKRVWL